MRPRTGPLPTAPRRGRRCEGAAADGAVEAPEEEQPATRIRATELMAIRVNSRLAVMVWSPSPVCG